MFTTEPHRRLDNLKNHYDLAVVGGGIYGATVAWEAASRGLDVVLLESVDFSSGTSANSLKTIHGGLRSLQRLDFGEMREYIRERRALMRIAPHLIRPMRCVMPTYKPLFKSRLFIGAGVKLYDLISYDRNRGIDELHRISASAIITRERLAELAPDLDQTAVTGGACWFDGQAYNSERLVLSFVMSALQAGADVLNYVEKSAYHFESGKLCRVSVRDRLSGDVLDLNLKAVVDCTGPWASTDEYFRKNARNKRPEIMARAVNLVIRRRLSDCAIGVRSRTGQEENDRLLFIAPWREGSIVGTWYYPEFASLDKPGLSEHELSACLAQINSVFPNARLDYEDVSLLHIGLQPAYSGKPGCQEPRLWRHTKILNDGSRTGQDGLYWVQGVKLTTARSTAVEVIERVARYLKKNISPSGTDETPLYGADFDDYGKYKRACHEKLSGHYPEHVVSRLLANYGSCLDVIVRLMKQDESLAEYVPGTTDTIRAELKYVIENEMPETLADVVLRRTDMGSFSCPDRKTLEFCANMMGGYFDWNETERRNQIENLLQHYPRYHN